MVSTVKPRPSHYETLGLDPTASDEEIARAFARAMRSPRPMSDVARIGLAYEVLRNAAKRRAYDESLGLRRAPQPDRAAARLSVRASAHFAPVTTPDRVKPAAAGGAPGPALPLNAQPEALAIPLAPRPERKPLPEAAAEPLPEPDVPEFLPVRRTRAQGSSDSEGSGIDWKYPAFAIGSVFVAVGLLGAWAGMSAGGDAAAAQAATTVALPAARPHPNRVPPPAVSTRETVEAESPGPARLSGVSDRVTRARARHRSIPPADRLSAISQSLASAAPANETVARDADKAVADAAPSLAAAAKLPLPDRVVARTIERIGYSCGEVSSTVQGEAPGVYTVTCTSGQSYQAKPVGGRYRFRRVAGR
jgi:hypothetical protein